VNCPDTDCGDVALVKAIIFIGGRDTVEELLACRLYPLPSNFKLGEVAEGITPVSKLRVSLPKFSGLSSKLRTSLELTAARCNVALLPKPRFRGKRISENLV
jgi:hypothetical protein